MRESARVSLFDSWRGVLDRRRSRSRWLFVMAAIAAAVVLLAPTVAGGCSVAHRLREDGAHVGSMRWPGADAGTDVAPPAADRCTVISCRRAPPRGVRSPLTYACA
jgi:hypothetical protein